MNGNFLPHQETFTLQEQDMKPFIIKIKSTSLVELMMTSVRTICIAMISIRIDGINSRRKEMFQADEADQEEFLGKIHCTSLEAI